MKGYFKKENLIIGYDDGNGINEAVLVFGYLADGKVVSKEVFRGQEARERYRNMAH